MAETSGTTFQAENEHAVAKVGHCPFCLHDGAELWRDPAEDWKPFQVRCASCGARGPWADCGWESAVPAWTMMRRRPLAEIIAEAEALDPPSPRDAGTGA